MKIFQKVLKSKTYSHYNKFVKDPIFICALPWWDCEEAYQNKGVYTKKYNVETPTMNNILERSCGIHLWNNFSYNKPKVNNVFKNNEDGSLYSILKARYIEDVVL